MKKLCILSFMFLTVVVFGSGRPEEDKYVGKTVDQLLLVYGDPSTDVTKLIDDYYIGFENEPDYSLYFKEQELRESVAVRTVVWSNKKMTIIIWAKKERNNWIIFSSLCYGKSVNF